MPDASRPRFLTLDDVAEELATSKNQIYALVRQGELAAVKIGGRGQWRVERNKLEEYIERAYAETRTFIRDNPYDQAADVQAGAEDATTLAAMSNPRPTSAAFGANGMHDAINPGGGAQRDVAEPEL